VALGVMALLIGLGTLQQTGAALATTLLALREIEEDGVVPAPLRKTAPSGSVTRIPVLVHTEEPWRLGVRPPPPRARWGRDGESHEVDRA
jgi:hypothetical protein